jgi:hypothetical protein
MNRNGTGGVFGFNAHRHTPPGSHFEFRLAILLKCCPEPNP